MQEIIQRHKLGPLVTGRRDMKPAANNSKNNSKEI
jgi:hypothetical protein